VGIIMGSVSDMETMAGARDMLKELDIPFEMRVVSAHRTPVEMFEYAEEAAGRGLKVIIAGAGGAAHLPGMLAAKTRLPVFGVPVATFAIGAAGPANAALFAVAMLAGEDAALCARLEAFRAAQTEAARAMTLPPAGAA